MPFWPPKPEGGMVWCGVVWCGMVFPSVFHPPSSTVSTEESHLIPRPVFPLRKTPYNSKLKIFTIVKEEWRKCLQWLCKESIYLPCVASTKNECWDQHCHAASVSVLPAIIVARILLESSRQHFSSIPSHQQFATRPRVTGSVMSCSWQPKLLPSNVCFITHLKLVQSYGYVQSPTQQADTVFRKTPIQFTGPPPLPSSPKTTHTQQQQLYTSLEKTT